MIAPTTTSSTLEVHFLNVGQGDATLIQTPNNRQVLIDASRGSAVLKPLQEIIPSYDKTLDAIVLTHPDADHIGGFVPILDTYEVEYALHPYTPFAETQIAQRVGILLSEHIPEKNRITIANYHTFTLDGVSFEFLWPLIKDSNPTKDRNYASIVTLVRYGDMEIVLMGDAPKEVEHRIIDLFPEKLRSIEILKLGHHGSKTSTSLAFLKHLTPEVAVISASASNPYGHPHREVLTALDTYSSQHTDEPITLYETKNGTISLCLSKQAFAECG